MTWHRPPLRPRLEGERHLVTRQYAALWADRHVNQVRRHCRPVACDVKTRQPLYDAEACVAALAACRRVLPGVSLDKDRTSGHAFEQ